ncbi:MAG: hypothetical protein QOJ19_2179, partial [Acidimicrobiia bacterium]|nr:hypothetical protein [Acidimicrobiia bacterium]
MVAESAGDIDGEAPLPSVIRASAAGAGRGQVGPAVSAPIVDLDSERQGTSGIAAGWWGQPLGWALVEVVASDTPSRVRLWRCSGLR